MYAGRAHGRCCPFISRSPLWLFAGLMCRYRSSVQVVRPFVGVMRGGEVHERGPPKVRPGEKIKISGLGNFEARKTDQ
jgi:hypothetical protein